MWSALLALCGVCVPLALCGGTSYRLVFFDENTDTVQSEITGGWRVLEECRINMEWKGRMHGGWLSGCVWRGREQGGQDN